MDTKINLPRKAAGHKMTDKVPVASSEQTIAETREYLIENADKFETINYIYVLSKSKKLRGVLNIKSALSSDLKDKVSKHMETKLVKAHPHSDRERVAHLALKNNIKAVPIIDKDDKFLGVLSSDDVLNIIAHESRSDLLQISGIIMGKNKLLSGDVVESPVSGYLRRIPWIMVGLFGGIFTANVISRFDGILEKNLMLASFIPLVAYLANAVGNQTQTLLIRNIATQPKFSFLKYSLKQFLVSSLIALTCWSMIVAISFAVWGEGYLGFVVGLSVSFAILTATFFSLFIPKTLDKLDIDPATGSGPFAAVIQDLLSILIYLVTASILV